VPWETNHKSDRRPGSNPAHARAPLIRSVPGQVTPEGHHGVVEVGEVLSEALAFDSLDPPNISVGQVPTRAEPRDSRHRQRRLPVPARRSSGGVGGSASHPTPGGLADAPGVTVGNEAGPGLHRGL
jgi:hypothetical protein